MLITDDGNHAIVQFVAWDRTGFTDLMADSSPDVIVFKKGKAKPADIEAAFGKYKKNFTMDQMPVVQP